MDFTVYLKLVQENGGPALFLSQRKKENYHAFSNEEKSVYNRTYPFCSKFIHFLVPRILMKLNI